MTDQVEEIKAKTDIVSVIGEYITLKKAGKNYKALCPFHSEKTPSFVVSPEIQYFKCFGCNESGDVIAFLQKYEGMDFYEALKYLADRAGIILQKSSFGEKSFKEKLYQINKFAQQFYHYILLSHSSGQKALSYLKNRGIGLNTIKIFQLGYSPDIAFAIKKFIVERKKVQLADLEKVGLIYFKDGRPFDRFHGRIIFPLMDHRDNPS